MSGLKLTGVKKIYDDGTEAVKDFSMEIADNEFVVLVGPSGCGKTTLLRMIRLIISKDNPRNPE